jgi:hypothetical protein
MAVNPMQRRARNSFLGGFLVALLIMACVVFALLYKIKGLNEAKEALESKQTIVWVAASDLESGAEVTMDSFIAETVQTTVDTTQVISMDDFSFIDESTGEIIDKYNEDGTLQEKTLIMKVAVPAGTIVTKDMISEVDDQVQDDQRLEEYNMIVLPSELKNNQYIDIRMMLPTGENYIVLSKKKVIQCNLTTIWLKMSEDEILTLGNAIVEAYTGTGIKLYASSYIEPGLQTAATPTYAVSEAVLKLIQTDPNIRTEARNALWARYNDQNQVEQRVNHINSILSNYEDSRTASVEAGFSEEISSLKEARQTFVDALEGTGEVGSSY